MSCALLLLTAQLLTAQQPVLDQLVPGGMARGAEGELTVTGKHLETVEEVMILGSTGVDLPEDGLVSKSTNRLVVRLLVAPDAPLTERELLVVSPHGISNPLRFLVGPWPALAEAEPNNTTAQAQTIRTPVTLEGRIEQPDDKDVFRFELQKGESIVIEIYAARRGSLLQPELEIRDGRSTTLKPERTALGRDWQLRLEAPATGTYEVWVQDAQGGGGEAYGYQIRFGPVPYLETVVPLG